MERSKIYQSTKELAFQVILNRPTCKLSESEYAEYIEALKFLELTVKNSVLSQLEYQSKED